MAALTHIGVDVGGTFTDAALITRDGDLVTAKVPSTADQSIGVMEGIRKVCTLAGIAPDAIDQFTHSMTVSVNALLEETGARTALITTKGFRDVLEIGRQNRPDLYDLNTDKSAPLAPRRRRFEVNERAAIDGIRRPVDESEIRTLAETLREQDVESVAVCFLHAYLHPSNEITAADILREELDIPVSVSHEVLAEFREYERTSTTVIDAYLTPEIDAYLSRLEERAIDAGVPAPRIMQANGGIAEVATIRRRAVNTIMSGPAAGVVGAGTIMQQAKIGAGVPAVAEEPPESIHREGLVTFDMGGTSSDVSLVRGGEIERTTHTVINGRPIKVPMVDVTTVGAGGGSIAWVDTGGALRVGPQSAGADPGPACYGKGGTQPTVTDANLLLGYIGATSRLGGELALDPSAAEAAVTRLAEKANLDGPIEAARGIYQVANATMTRAIRAVTVERGYDPRGFALAAFGGAGPMHAAGLAEALEMNRIVIPRACGVLSAFGLLAADEKYDSVRTYRCRLTSADAHTIDDLFETLREEVLMDISTAHEAALTYAADLRYAGQSFEITVPIDRPFEAKQVATAFHRQHEAAYGYQADDPIELINLRADAAVAGESPRVQFTGGDGAVRDQRPAYFSGEFITTPIFDWDQLQPGQEITGPAIIEHSESTVVLPPRWEGLVRIDGTLVIVVGV